MTNLLLFASAILLMCGSILRPELSDLSLLFDFDRSLLIVFVIDLILPEETLLIDSFGTFYLVFCAYIDATTAGSLLTLPLLPMLFYWFELFLDPPCGE